MDQFYDRVLADPDLARYFTNTDLVRLKAHQRGCIPAAIGGSEIYQGRSIKEAHAPPKIEPPHFDKVAGHLVHTLTALDVAGRITGQIGELAPLKADIAPDQTATPASSKRLWHWFRSRAMASEPRCTRRQPLAR